MDDLSVAFDIECSKFVSDMRENLCRAGFMVTESFGEQME